MKLNESAQKHLLKVIGIGLKKSAERLSKISNTKWEIQTIATQASATEDFLAKAGQGGPDSKYYGAYFSMPGWGFLVLFFMQSGAALADVFLPAGIGEEKAKLNQQDVVAEISNIMIGALAGTLADACDIVCILSAPEMNCAKKETLLKLALGKFRAGGDDVSILTDIHMSSEALSSDCSVVVFANPEAVRCFGYNEQPGQPV
jgi:chemotaxis protein CheY-P-specific phosphatase CheC